MDRWRGNEFYLMWLLRSDCACLDGTIDTVNGRRVVISERERGEQCDDPFAYSAVLIFGEFAHVTSRNGCKHAQELSRGLDTNV